MKQDISKLQIEIHCQKCDAPDMKVPVTRFRGAVIGTLDIPDTLRCANCFAVLTTVIREVDEKKKPKKG